MELWMKFQNQIHKTPDITFHEYTRSPLGLKFINTNLIDEEILSIDDFGEILKPLLEIRDII